MKRVSNRLSNIYAGPIVGKTFMKGGQGRPCKLYLHKGQRGLVFWRRAADDDEDI
jgi:hypothetical protein